MRGHCSLWVREMSSNSHIYILMESLMITSSLTQDLDFFLRPIRTTIYSVTDDQCNLHHTCSNRYLFSGPFVSLFLLPAVSSPQTENTRSTYASDAGADNKSCARGAERGYFISFTIQKSNPLSCANMDTLPCLMQWLAQCNLTLTHSDIGKQ